MKLSISAVVVCMLNLVPCCLASDSLTSTQFRFYSQQRIEKNTNMVFESMLKCAASSSVEGERIFSYNPHLRLCVIGAHGKGSLSNSAITKEENTWLLYFKQAKSPVKQGKYTRSTSVFS